MRRLFTVALMLGLAFSPFQMARAADAKAAAKPAASAFTDKQRAELQDMIKQYIMDNPQTLIASVETHYNKQQETQKIQEGALGDIPKGLLDNPNTPFVGPKDAKITVVEFFDYTCGFCKQVALDVSKVIDEEKEVKFIFKELPILSDMSEVAARYALAANKQGKYIEFHNALMMNQGPLSEDTILAHAKVVGLNVDKLKADANSQEFRDELAKNVDLARGLGVRGTPFFVVGKEKIPGAIGYSRIKELIAAQRNGGSAPAASAAAPAVDTTPAAAPSADPEVQAQIDKAKNEAKTMIDELKKQAEAMRDEGLAVQKQIEAEQAKQKAAEAAPAAKK